MTAYRYYIHAGDTAVRLRLEPDGGPDRTEVWDGERFRVDDSFMLDVIMGSEAVEVDAERFADWVAEREAARILGRPRPTPARRRQAWPWARKEMH